MVNYIKSSNIFTLKFQTLSLKDQKGIMAAKAKDRGWVTIKNGKRKGKKHVASNPILESQTGPKSSSSLLRQMKILCSLPPAFSYFQFSLFMQDPKNDSTTRYAPSYYSSLLSSSSTPFLSFTTHKLTHTHVENSAICSD